MLGLAGCRQCTVRFQSLMHRKTNRRRFSQGFSRFSWAFLSLCLDIYIYIYMFFPGLPNIYIYVFALRGRRVAHRMADARQPIAHHH